MKIPNPYQKYQNNQILGLDREDILLLLYDTMIKQVEVALQAISENKIEEKLRAVSKTVNILMELRGALKKEVAEDLTQSLEQLYEYMIFRLTIANYKNDTALLREVRTLLQELRTAWGTAAAEYKKQKAAANAGPGPVEAALAPRRVMSVG
ncbi:MAG: flagellar export chaperone FliS [Nitrospirae bacterium]|nr:flagellar export chaperone FliS [Nitrospirota bacterium]